MDENNLKIIVTGVVNKAIDPIREDLSGVKKDLNRIREDLNGVKKDIVEIKGVQKDHTGRLEALSGDMEQVLSEVKATHDEIKRHVGLPLMSDIPEV